MKNNIIADLKKQYIKEYASLVDLVQCYPELSFQEVQFLLQESGVKLRDKHETKTAKTQRRRWLAEKNRPTVKQLQALKDQHKTAQKMWIVAFKGKGIDYTTLQEWLKEANLTRRSPKRMTKEERMRRILAKVSGE